MRNHVLLCVWLLLVAAFHVHAAGPNIADANASAEHGDAVTLTGCAFGTNALDYSYFNAETESLGTRAAFRANAPGWPEGWSARINTSLGAGSMPFIDDYTTHAGQRAIRCDVYNNSSHTSNLQYMPVYDSAMGAVDDFSEVFVSFWFNLKLCDGEFGSAECPPGHSGFDPIELNGEGTDGHWKFLHISHGSDDMSNSTQAGGNYFEFYVDKDSKLCTRVTPTWGFQDIGRADCSPGSSDGDGIQCPGVNCDHICKYCALPGNDTGQLGNNYYDYAHYKSGGNTDGDKDPNNEFEDAYASNTWMRFDMWWKFSSVVGARDASHQVRLFRSGRSRPVNFLWDANFASHLDSVFLTGTRTLPMTPWAAIATRVNFMGYLGHRFMSASIFYDDMFVQIGTQARVELGDRPLYSACSLLELQPVTTWADDEIVFDFNVGAWASGQWKWLYVINDDGLVNEQGRPIWLGPGDPPITTPPMGPRDHRFDEGLGG